MESRINPTTLHSGLKASFGIDVRGFVSGSKTTRSGDLRMQTMGGRGVEMNVANVLFVGAKMSAIQRLIATKPDEPQQA